MFPLLLTPRPSRLLLGARILLALLAVSALWLANLPWAARLAGLCALAVALALTSRSRPITLRCKQDGGLNIRRGDTWKAVTASVDSLALPWLAVLVWEEDGRAHRLAIPRDALTPDEHRRLRLWLRWRVKPLRDAPLESAG